MSVADYQGATKQDRTMGLVVGWIDRHGFTAALAFTVAAWACVAALAYVTFMYLF